MSLVKRVCSDDKPRLVEGEESSTLIIPNSCERKLRIILGDSISPTKIKFTFEKEKKIKKFMSLINEELDEKDDEEEELKYEITEAVKETDKTSTQKTVFKDENSNNVEEEKRTLENFNFRYFLVNPETEEKFNQMIKFPKIPRNEEKTKSEHAIKLKRENDVDLDEFEESYSDLINNEDDLRHEKMFDTKKEGLNFETRKFRIQDSGISVEMSSISREFDSRIDFMKGLDMKKILMNKFDYEEYYDYDYDLWK